MPALSKDRWLAASPHLDHALDLPPDERSAWLGALRADDAALAEDVAALLAEHDRLSVERFLEQGAPSMPPAVAAGAGQRLGRYRLVSELGRGARSTVWLVRREDRPQEVAALKLLDGRLDRAAAERRSRAAARVARLAHPHVAQMIDAGVAPTGQPYLVQEHVPGEPIDRHCDVRRLDLAARAVLFLDVAAAIAHAHAHLVVHLRLKPSNVRVREDGQVKVVDFGAGRPAEASASEAGTSEPVTTAVDVRALGGLLAGLVAAAPAASDALLRADLDAIAAKARHERARERYASVDALAADVERALRHEPVRARPGPGSDRTARFVRRHRGRLAAAAAGVVALVAAATLAAWGMVSARRERDRARDAARQAELSSDLASRILDELEPGARPPALGALLDRGVEILETRYAAEPRFVGMAMVEMAGRYLDLQRPDKQQELLARAVSLAARSDDPEVMACAQCATARASRRVGDAPAAATALAEGRRALARLDRPGLPARVECLRAEAEASEAEGRGDEAIARLGQARALLEPGVIAGPLYAGVLDDLAGLLHRQGRPRDALAVNLTRVHAFDREGRGGPLARARVVHARAVLLDAVGEVVASEAEARRARELAEEGAGLADASLVLTHARALDRLGRSAEALALLQRLAPDGERRHDAALWPRLRLQTAAALIHAGDLAAAAAPLQEAEQRCAGDPAAHGRDLREARRLRAEIALRAGEPRAAQEWLDRPAPTPASGEAPGDRLAWNRTAARVALARGDAAAAAVRAAEAAQVAEQIARDPAASADVGEALLLQARAARALGRDAEAGALLARAATALAAGLGAEHELARQAREARAPRPGPKA